MCVKLEEPLPVISHQKKRYKRSRRNFRTPPLFLFAHTGGGKTSVAVRVSPPFIPNEVRRRFHLSLSLTLSLPLRRLPYLHSTCFTFFFFSFFPFFSAGGHFSQAFVFRPHSFVMPLFCCCCMPFALSWTEADPLIEKYGKPTSFQKKTFFPRKR